MYEFMKLSRIKWIKSFLLLMATFEIYIHKYDLSLLLHTHKNKNPILKSRLKPNLTDKMTFCLARGYE